MYDACLLHSRSERVLKGLVSDALKQWDVTRMEWLLLATAAEPSPNIGGHTMGEAAAVLDIQMSQLNALVTRMAAGGYIELNQATHDKRVKYIETTPQGEALLADIEVHLRTTMREWLKHIERDKLVIYMEVLEQLGEVRDHDLQ